MRFMSLVAGSLFVSANAWAVCPPGTQATTSPCPNRFPPANFTDVCRVSGTLVNDVTFTSDNLYVLDGRVLVGPDRGMMGGVASTDLTIQAGTTLVGAGNDDFLVVSRGNQIFARGTAQAPVVFTACTEAPGSFGGLILNGRAPVNFSDLEDRTCTPGSPCEFEGEGNSGLYGGGTPNDSSGVLNYVRVEFGGDQIAQLNELNGIAFQGVGSGTDVDFIQAHRCEDDGIEFFGGTVDVNFAVVTEATDDGFDWTSGWQGQANNVLVVQNGVGDNGIEADNVDNPNAWNLQPRSQPRINALTISGARNHAALFRRGTGANITNAIFTGSTNAPCLDIDDSATFLNTTTNVLRFGSSVVGNCPGGSFDDQPGDLLPVSTIFLVLQPTNQEDNSISLINGYLSPAGETRGAVNVTNDWTAGWTVGL